MTKVILLAAFWCLTYLVLALLPLGIAVWGESATGRGFLTELGVGFGIAGFAMMVLQFFTTTRFRWVAPRFGTDAKNRFHRETGIMAVLFVLAHPFILFFADRRFLDFIDPRVNLPRALFLSAATAALVLLIVLPLARKALQMSYEWWRVTHGLLAFLVIFVGLVHALQVGFYVYGALKQAVWVAFAACAMALLFHTRIIKPLQMRSRPYRVAKVRQETSRVYTLVLEPEGHSGMRFRAGQYAWLTLGQTPFTLQQHPFSFASSAAQPQRVEFAIKQLGDFTATIGEVRPGTRAFVEGPYGAFTLDPEAEGAVFIVGGIGISPIMSILRTCRDSNDRRPMLLIYGNGAWEKAAFREELDRLSRELDLTVVHVLEEPPADWTGESGLLTRELLARHLGSWRDRDAQYLICGPLPMMNAVERALLAEGVPQWRLTSERFDMV